MLLYAPADFEQSKSMSISRVGLAPQAQPSQQAASDTPATASAGATQSGGGSLPQDRVEISGEKPADKDAPGKLAADSTAHTSQSPNPAVRRQTLYPGQRGYVPPSILSQFDPSGRALKSGSQLDIQA